MMKSNYLPMVLSAYLLITSMAVPAYAAPEEQMVKKKKVGHKLSQKQVEACVSKWASIYRKQASANLNMLEDDIVVRWDMIEEWEAWCKQGKQPKSSYNFDF